LEAAHEFKTSQALYVVRGLRIADLLEAARWIVA
jgi:hypothetical protein